MKSGSKKNSAVGAYFVYEVPSFCTGTPIRVRGNCTITHNQRNQHNQRNHTITQKNDAIKQKNSDFGQDDQCEIHNQKTYQHNQRNQHNQ